MTGRVDMIITQRKTNNSCFFSKYNQAHERTLMVQHYWGIQIYHLSGLNLSAPFFYLELLLTTHTVDWILVLAVSHSQIFLSLLYCFSNKHGNYTALYRHIIDVTSSLDFGAWSARHILERTNLIKVTKCKGASFINCITGLEKGKLYTWTFTRKTWKQTLCYQFS